MQSGLDKLQSVLARAQKAASLAQQAVLKERLRKKFARQAIQNREVSEDYAQRLQDRSIYRGLLADDRLDAGRFRWYFTQIENTIPLDQLRHWIDSKMIKEQR